MRGWIVVAAMFLFGAMVSVRSQTVTVITGGGSTLTEAVHNELVQVYEARTVDAKLSYNPVGSSGGLRNLTQRLYNYAGTDSIPSTSLYAQFQDLQVCAVEFVFEKPFDMVHS